jgi:polyphosphate:AMP phosphotransferase
LPDATRVPYNPLITARRRGKAMFETAELGHCVSKEKYKAAVGPLRSGLLGLQRDLAASGQAAVVLVGGVEGAGKAEAINRLLEWLDARGVEIHALSDPTDEERERPPMWRFWRRLPPKGRAGIFLGSWYTDPIVERAFGRTGNGRFHRQLDAIADFEKMLDQEGVILIKIWLHISKEQMRNRLKALEKDPDLKWRVTPRDWKYFGKYDRFRAASEQALMHTSTGWAPWHIVEATDGRYRDLQVGKVLSEVLRDRLKRESATPPPERRPDLAKPPERNVLRALDLSLKVEEKRYERALEKKQTDLSFLARRLYEKQRSLILVFEGPDAAGKGGVIRRLTSAMDMRNARHISIAAPTEEERTHPYLWRFWRHLPRLGRVTIFDRSWYGRVLVERVEGFCTKEEWQRAYAEINAFEEELAEFGFVLLKFWLALSAQEQLRRFKQRQETPYKQYKITPEDWRNRAKWDAYEAAALDTFERTSTGRAPWILVEAEDKNFARLKVLDEVNRHLAFLRK